MITASNLLTVIIIAQYLIFPKLHKILELLYKMKSGFAMDISTFSNSLEEHIFPIIKNDTYSEKYITIDLKECVRFMCSTKQGKYDIKLTWVLSWFNMMLSVEKLDLVRVVPYFTKEIVEKVGTLDKEFENKAVEKFLHDLRYQVVRKNHIRNLNFATVLLKNLMDSYIPEKSNRKHLYEVLKWMLDILSIQLSDNVLRERKFDPQIDFMLNNQIPFETIISDALLFTLQVIGNEEGNSKMPPADENSSRPLANDEMQQRLLSGEDSHNKAIALKINSLIQDKILQVVNLGQAKETSARIFETLQNMITEDKNLMKVYYAMKWIEHLIDNVPTELTNLSSKIILNLKKGNSQLVQSSVILIAKIVNKFDDCQLVSSVLKYLEETINKDLDQSKSLSILKTLFTHINPEKLMLYLAGAIRESTNQEFRVTLIRNLDLILNMEESLHNLRVQLQDPKQPLFEELFRAWCLDYMSALSISLLSLRYRLAFEVAKLLHTIMNDSALVYHANSNDPNQGEQEDIPEYFDAELQLKNASEHQLAIKKRNESICTRLAQLARLFDMAHYAKVRLHLTSPKQHPYLVKTLRTLLKYLPQGPAFDSLLARLKSSALLPGASGLFPATDRRADADPTAALEVIRNTSWYQDWTSGAELA